MKFEEKLRAIIRRRSQYGYTREFDKWNSCLRKRLRFATREEAAAEAKRRKMTSYKCKYCEQYHLATRRLKVKIAWKDS